MKSYIAVCALLGNLSRASIISELIESQENSPCKNGLCEKYMKQINTKNENWVEDHHDSISHAESEEPEAESKVVDQKDDGFKKKHHFKKEWSDKKTLATAETTETSEEDKATPESSGNTQENDNNKTPKRKHRKGRKHLKRRDSKHDDIEDNEDPVAHEKDQGDRHHDTGVGHHTHHKSRGHSDLESEIHRDVEGLDDLEYRSRHPAAERYKRSYDRGQDRDRYERSDRDSGRYSDQDESYNRRGGFAKADQYDDHRQNYRGNDRGYDRGYDSGYGGSHHVLQRADDVIRSVNHYVGNGGRYHYGEKGQDQVQEQKGHAQSNESTKNEEGTENKDHAHVPKKSESEKQSKKESEEVTKDDTQEEEPKQTTKVQKKKSKHHKKSTKPKVGDEQEESEVTDEVESPRDADPAKDEDVQLQSIRGAKTSYEPEWAHNDGSSYNNGPTDHFYHGKASPYSVVREDVQLESQYEPEWAHNSGNSYENGPTDHFYHGKASPYSLLNEDLQLSSEISPTMFETTVSLKKSDIGSSLAQGKHWDLGLSKIEQDFEAHQPPKMHPYEMPSTQAQIYDVDAVLDGESNDSLIQFKKSLKSKFGNK